MVILIKSLEEIDGIGVKTAELFHKLGIFDVYDLIYYYPKRYEILKRSNMSLVADQERVVVDGIVECQPTMVSLSFKLKKVLFRIFDGRGIYHVVAFNHSYLCKQLHSGMKVIVIGKYDQMRNTIVASEVRLGELCDKVQIEAVYGTTEGLNRKIIRRAIHFSLKSGLEIEDYIPDYLISQYHFPTKLWSISQIHFPVDSVSYRKARQRLKYEELFLYLMKINYFRMCLCQDTHAIQREFDELKLNSFIETLDFSLTADQEKALEEIKDDLISDRRMNRLVQGDVGSGKTIVAFLASYINFLSGYQTALMVPTEILANQHYDNACKLFKNTDMQIAILTSSISRKNKEKILNQIGNGEIDLVIGTQSLIQEKVEYANLGLIITDEQHRFGVNQRNELKNKGSFPDILSMSATPIPRTYALTIYGDMDVSNIRVKPAGRKEVITYCKCEDDMFEVLEMMKKEIDLGHQIYVIAPSIEKGNSDELNNVLYIKEKMQIAFGKICRVEAVHGKLGNEEKNIIMKQFEDGRISILISTTVIEVGVNVPNASMIVIFQSNLFGLSTLHQLRGRVGRGTIQSYCILISKDKFERLQMLEKSNDGFFISEYDFKCRGEGDLFGVRQSGEAFFKIADIRKDFDLLVRVKSDVDDFFNCHFGDVKYQKFWDCLAKLNGLN